jgi:hypothetical protein
LEFKQVSKRLLQQTRAMVQQVLGEAREKLEVKSLAVGTTAHNLDTGVTQGTLVNMGMSGNWGGVANPSLQQPFYETHADDPNSQVIPNTYFPRPPIVPVTVGGAYPRMSKNVREQVARTLREFRLEPKGRVRTYQKLYPEFFDNVPYPRGFRVPDLVKFMGEDSKMSYKHIGKFLAQVSDFKINDVHKIRLFSLPLSGTTLNWFMSLSANSVDTWERLEQMFHDYFYNGETELRLSHLVYIKQKNNDTIVDYMRRFRDVRNKCYGLTIRKKTLPS